MMTKFKNIFTTPAQSKRLLELGVPADSANMFWSASDGNYPSIELLWDVYIRNGQSLDSDFFKIYNMNEFQVIPCWSVGRLIEIYIIANGLDTAYLPIERGEDMVKYLIQLYEEKVKDLDFSKLEE